MNYVVVGVSSRTGRIHKLEPAKSTGKYILVGPDVLKNERRFSENYTLVDTIEEAICLIRSGYCARMKNLENNNPPDLIKNDSIKVFEMK